MLDSKAIDIVVPLYIGGGAEKITDIIFNELIHKYHYKVRLITLAMNDLTRPRAEAIGYNSIDLSELGANFNSAEADNAILTALKNSNAAHVVYVGVAPDDIERYRKELPDKNIILHLHSMLLWEVKAKLLSTKRFCSLYSTKKYFQWYVFKYLKEKIFKVYTHRYKKRYRRLAANVNHIAVLTDSYRIEYNKILGMNATNSRSKVCAIYNPFDPQKLLPLSKQKKSNEILYLGRFHCLEKGVDNLLRTWKYISKSLPDWKLKLVGKGPDRNYMEYLISALDIPRVEIHEYTSNVSEHLSTASILCLPSNNEGWGMVLIEAMAAGVVPVAYNCSGGVRELLENKRGVLIKPGDFKGMGRAIQRLINSPEEMERRRNLYPDFVRLFSTERAVNQFLSLLNYNNADGLHTAIKS